MSRNWQAIAGWLALIGIVSPCFAQQTSCESVWPCPRSAFTAPFSLNELPEKPTNPEQTLISHFSALSLAGRPPYLGSTPSAEEAARRAYDYLSRETKRSLTFQEFKNSLTGIAGLRLLKLFSANYGDDTDPAYIPRYFAEIEKLEERRTGLAWGSVFAYYYGFYTLTKEDGTFRILCWDTQPEDFVSPLKGHQPWRYDAGARARQYVWEKVFHSKGPLPALVTVLQREENFATVRLGKETGGHSVYLARLESGEWMPLYLTDRPASFPGPAPPEQRMLKIAFVRFQEGRSEICAMRGDGSQVTRVTGGPGYYSDPSWSPDGGKIAFVCDRTGNEDVYLMDADGSNLRKLTTGPANEHSPAWSPDGTRIAFAADSEDPGQRGLYLTDLQGPLPRRLSPRGMRAFCPGWSRDGKRIRFRSDRGLWAIDADGSNLERLVWISDWDEEVAFAPDDRTAALIRFNAPPHPDERRWDVYVMDFERNELRQITFDGLEKHEPSWVTNSLLTFRLHKEDLDQLYWLDISSGGMAPVAPDQGKQLDGSAVTVSQTPY